MENKKLIFVTKFAQLGFDALRSLLNLRGAALEHIVFVNVIERDRVAMRSGTGYQKREEIRLRETANIRFIDWAETLFEEGMEVGVYIVVGGMVPEVIKATKKEEADPIEEIEKAARECQATMIVLGSSAKTSWVERWLGSIFREIAEESIYPTLIIPPEKSKP